MTQLDVDFVGEVRTLSPGDQLSFGRQGDLVVDDENRYLHRRLGVFSYDGGQWWVQNTGSSIPLALHDLTSRSHASIGPGRSAALTFPNAVLRFGAGKTNYEIELSVDAAPVPGEVFDTNAEDDEDPDSSTISLAELPLTDDQLRLIVVLAESVLSSAGAPLELPTNRTAAHRLGWTITRFNRKLDNVCARLTKAGVSGLRGDIGALATDRRTALVEHAVHSGLVTEHHLHLLEPVPSDNQPVSSGE